MYIVIDSDFFFLFTEQTLHTSSKLIKIQTCFQVHYFKFAWFYYENTWFLFRLYLGFGSMQCKAGNRQEVCFDKCFVVVFFVCFYVS